MFTEHKGSQVPGTSSSPKHQQQHQQLSHHYAPPFASLSFALPAPKAVAFGLRAAPFASLSSSSSSMFGAAQQEAATGHTYPQELCVLTKKHCPQLAGVG